MSVRLREEVQALLCEEKNMTDRAKGLTVVLEQDVRVDDLEALVSAIECMRGVVHVEPVITSTEDYFVETRVRRELLDRIFEIFKE